MDNIQTNNIKVKKINRSRVFKLIYKKGSLSKQHIVDELSVSLPTVTQNLKELQKKDLIKYSGSFESTGGRKARAISCNNMAKLAVGVDVTKNHVVLVIIDMCGNIIQNKRLRIPFRYENEYFEKVGGAIEEIINSDGIEKGKILGVGISVPGLLSEDGETVTYANVLGFTGGKLKEFSKHIKYPTTLSNDAVAAGLAEFWNSDEAVNSVYISLSNSVGGSILLNKKFYLGETCRSGEFGHMTIEPNGRQCYCGQKGCIDAYCNSTILAMEANGNIWEFFKNLETNAKYKKVWNEYFEYLTIVVNNLRMIFDCNIILGGYVGSCMEKYLPLLREKVSVLNSFEINGKYVDVCKYKIEASAVGAALEHIKEFISQI